MVIKNFSKSGVVVMKDQGRGLYEAEVRINEDWIEVPVTHGVWIPCLNINRVHA